MFDADRFRAALSAWAAGDPAAAEAARARAAGLTTIILVEGVSDLAALEALASLRGRDLAADGMCVVPMGGAMSVARFLRVLSSGRLAVGVRGLFDVAEEEYARRALTGVGREPGPGRAGLAECGFFVCEADLEDELIRALGHDGVERVLAAGRDLARFRLFQNQPAQRGRSVDRQLRRFLGTTSGRKAAYARRLTLALDPARVPAPLDRALA